MSTSLTFATTPLASRGLRPVADLAQGRPHGDRLRYMAGCRCAECRRANTAYETARAAARKAGDWNGIVPAQKARQHLAALSTQGVGRRAVGDACDVSDTVLAAIIAGQKTHIRARTERAILAVTSAAAADHALIDAGPTWVLLDDLIADRYSKAELARRLGYKTPALQVGRRQVTVRTAADVACLHATLRMVDAKPTVRRLNALLDEGYTRRQIEQRVAEIAAASGIEAPRIALRDNGAISLVLATTEQLIERAHAALLELP